MKIILQEKDDFIESLQSSAQIYSYSLSNENTRCKGSSGEIMGKTQENTGMAADESQRAEPYTLHRSWTSVISRIRCWSHSFKNTNVESYSEVTL